MRKILFFCLLPAVSCVAQLCSGNAGPKSPCAGWEALSQLGSVMPERIWEQEFTIFVDTKAFRKKLPDWMSHYKEKKDLKPLCLLGKTQGYFLKTTLSGDGVRLIDQYEEFHWSPFWKYPGAEVSLNEIEKQIKQGDH